MKRSFKRSILCFVLIFGLMFALPVAASANEGTLVTQGILTEIRSTLVNYIRTHKNFLTKAIVRTEFKMVANAGKAVGLSTASALLKHSLSNNPSDFEYGTSSSYAKQIAESEEYNTIIKTFIKAAADKTSYTLNSSIKLDSSMDLYLSYNLLSYTATGTKTGNDWNISVTFRDVYDFDKMAWSNSGIGNNAVVIINNYAAYAQSLGVVTPYNIRITVESKLTVE